MPQMGGLSATIVSPSLENPGTIPVTERATHLSAKPAVPPAAAADTPSKLSDRVRSLRLPQQPPAQSAIGEWIPWILSLVFACSTAALGYQLWQKSKDEKLASSTSNAGSSPSITVLSDSARAAEG